MTDSPAVPAGDSRDEHLLGIGAAAQKAGVSQRALRYYQQLGLITPCASTPGGLRRYSEDDLARVARIRQLQQLLGLNLDEIAVVLGGEDRMAEIRLAYQDEGTSRDKRQALLRESLDVQRVLRATVEAKRQGIEGFLADLDARISKTQAYLDQMEAPAAARESDAVGGARRR
ncbi:MAG TPA: MerR family transcriptional regulator [Streptosporangiaceae bacterium]|nr:MerR family transcriptional regulator [Streptosporangiaceae bacterium]